MGRSGLDPSLLLAGLTVSACAGTLRTHECHNELSLGAWAARSHLCRLPTDLVALQRLVPLCRHAWQPSAKSSTCVCGRPAGVPAQAPLSCCVAAQMRVHTWSGSLPAPLLPRLQGHAADHGPGPLPAAHGVSHHHRKAKGSALRHPSRASRMSLPSPCLVSSSCMLQSKHQRLRHWRAAALPCHMPFSYCARLNRSTQSSSNILFCTLQGASACHNKSPFSKSPEACWLC